MKIMQRVQHAFLLVIPVLLLALLLPFLLAFDSVMYMITRPTCLNCGSLGEYVRSSSLSARIIAGMATQLGQKYGEQIKEVFGRHFQLKKSTND